MPIKRFGVASESSSKDTSLREGMTRREFLFTAGGATALTLALKQLFGGKEKREEEIDEPPHQRILRSLPDRILCENGDATLKIHRVEGSQFLLIVILRIHPHPFNEELPGHLEELIERSDRESRVVTGYFKSRYGIRAVGIEGFVETSASVVMPIFERLRAIRTRNLQINEELRLLRMDVPADLRRSQALRAEQDALGDEGRPLFTRLRGHFAGGLELVLDEELTALPTDQRSAHAAVIAAIQDPATTADQKRRLQDEREVASLELLLPRLALRDEDAALAFWGAAHFQNGDALPRSVAQYNVAHPQGKTSMVTVTLPWRTEHLRRELDPKQR